MALHFQSILSGSSGNCLLLWTGETRLLIDAGFRAQRDFVEVLGHVLPDVDGVVVSHLHGGHINYSSLRVLEEHGVPVYVHEGDTAFLGEKHFKGRGFSGLELRPFSSKRFRVGEFSIEPFELPHEPGYTTFGFEVSCTQKGRQTKVVLGRDADGCAGI